MKKVAANRVFVFIIGLLMVIGGVYCLFTPKMTYMALGYVIGFNMIIDAIGGIIIWIQRKKQKAADNWALAGAIVSLIFGILLIGNDLLQIAVDMTIVYIAAVWMIVLGVVRIMLSHQLHRIRRELDAQILGRKWWLVMILGILMIAAGVFSLFNPTGLIIAIGINFGINIIIAGANMIAAAI